MLIWLKICQDFNFNLIAFATVNLILKDFRKLHSRPHYSPLPSSPRAHVYMNTTEASAVTTDNAHWWIKRIFFAVWRRQKSMGYLQISLFLLKVIVCKSIHVSLSQMLDKDQELIKVLKHKRLFSYAGVVYSILRNFWSQTT